MGSHRALPIFCLEQAALVADLAMDSMPSEETPSLRTWTRSWLPEDLAAIASLSAARRYVAEVLDADIRYAPEERPRRMAEAWAKAKPALAAAEKFPAVAPAVKHLRAVAEHFRRLARAPEAAAP